MSETTGWRRGDAGDEAPERDPFIPVRHLPEPAGGAGERLTEEELARLAADWQVEEDHQRSLDEIRIGTDRVGWRPETHIWHGRWLATINAYRADLAEARRALAAAEEDHEALTRVAELERQAEETAFALRLARAARDNLREEYARAVKELHEAREYRRATEGVMDDLEMYNAVLYKARRWAKRWKAAASIWRGAWREAKADDILVRRAQERRQLREAQDERDAYLIALTDLYIGAEQQAQSHADVMALVAETLNRFKTPKGAGDGRG